MPSPASNPTAIPADAPPTLSPALSGRLTAAIVFSVSAGILIVALILTPSANGIGTHQSLGLPPCGMEKATGIPCATCGMTTSFSLAAHGDLIASFTNQPAGALLALLTAMTAVLSGYALLTGMDLAPLARSLWRPRTIVIGAAVLIGAWVYKIIIHTGALGAGV